jgi:two-component system response regulator
MAGAFGSNRLREAGPRFASPFPPQSSKRGGERKMNFESQPVPVDILLVEDNEEDVRLTQEVLKSSKVRNKLIIASNGREALECLRKQGKFAASPRPDLILLDLNLRVMDGREVLERIKDDLDCKRIPVVILTTSKAE